MSESSDPTETFSVNDSNHSTPVNSSSSPIKPAQGPRLSMSPEPILFALTVAMPAVLVGGLAALLNSYGVTDWVVIPLVVITILAALPALGLLIIEFFGSVIPYVASRWRYHWNKMSSHQTRPHSSHKDDSDFSGAVVNGKEEADFDVYIGKGSIWSNPFQIGRDGDRATVMKKFEEYLLSNPTLMAKLPELRGKRLGCFCKPKDCHGHILSRYAEISEGGLDSSSSPVVTS